MRYCSPGSVSTTASGRFVDRFKNWFSLDDGTALFLLFCPVLSVSLLTIDFACFALLAFLLFVFLFCWLVSRFNSCFLIMSACFVTAK